MGAVQPRHLMRHPPGSKVPEAQRAVKVARSDQGAVGCDR